MQIPLVIQQYVQNLTGREAELRIQVDAMRRMAESSGKSLTQFIQKFLSSTDTDFASQGRLMENMVDRWHYLTESFLALQNSSVFTRPFVFFLHADFDIFKSTLKNHSLGFPLSLEGAVYALIGLAVGYVLFSGIRRLGARLIGVKTQVPLRH